MSRAKIGNAGNVGTPSREAVAAFLRELASRAETDAAFAKQLAEALRASGLLPTQASVAPATSSVSASARASRATAASSPDAAPDPFSLLRERGEAGLRATLDTLDLATLRQIVRTHHLDPNRISARWSAKERVVALIVEQVRARANHGKAFARV